MVAIRKNWQVPWTLVAIAVAAMLAWGFIVLLEEVSEGDTRAVDEAIILAFRVPGNPADPIGEPWFEEAMRDITALGSAPTLIIAVLAVVGFLARSLRCWQAAAGSCFPRCSNTPSTGRGPTWCRTATSSTRPASRAVIR